MKTSTRHHLFPGNPNPQQTRKTSLPTNRVERHSDAESHFNAHCCPSVRGIHLVFAYKENSLGNSSNPNSKQKQNKTKHDRHHTPSPRTDLTAFVSGAIAASRGSSSEILKKRSWYFRDQRTFFTDHRICKQ